MSQLRTKFFEETGVCWENSQGEPDIEYVNWLETKVENFNDRTTIKGGMVFCSFGDPIKQLEDFVEKHKSTEEPFICPIEKHNRPCGYRENKKVLCPKCGSEMDEMSAIGLTQWNCTNKECRFVEDDY